MRVEYKKLTESDVASIIEIAKLSFPKVWKESEFVYFLNHDCGLCYGAFLDTQLIGYFIGLLVRGELDVVSIATDPKYRRTKIAKSLFEYVWEKHEVFEGFLEVDSENHAALKLFEKIGFQKYGVRRKYYEGVRDAVVMKKTTR